MTIQDLHRLAYRRIPRERVHETLHDWAVQRFGVASLTECTDAQLRGLAALIASYPPPTSRGLEPARSAGQGDPSPAPPAPPAPPRRRAARSGQRRDPGVHKMITSAQIDFIHTLCSELGWSASTLQEFVIRELGGLVIDDVRDLGTSVQASRLINLLIGRRRSLAASRNRGPSAPAVAESRKECPSCSG